MLGSSVDIHCVCVTTYKQLCKHSRTLNICRQFVYIAVESVSLYTALEFSVGFIAYGIVASHIKEMILQRFITVWS